MSDTDSTAALNTVKGRTTKSLVIAVILVYLLEVGGDGHLRVWASVLGWSGRENPRITAVT